MFCSRYSVFARNVCENSEMAIFGRVRNAQFICDSLAPICWSVKGDSSCAGPYGFMKFFRKWKKYFMPSVGDFDGAESIKDSLKKVFFK